MRNYYAYFNSLDCVSYRVDIIADTSTTEGTEIFLAGDNPFVVQYNTSDTPFAPVRNSTAEINIVWDDYLLDAISPEPMGTQVILTNQDTGEIEWKGFLNPTSISNQGYEHCYETITLDCSDAVSQLQYLNYEILGTSKAIVNVKDIIANIITRTKIMSGFY